MDYVLYHILKGLNGNSSDPISEVIFLVLPSVGPEAFQSLLRLLSGMGDFARVHSHMPRWEKFPFLRESTQGRRFCLYCLIHARSPVARALSSLDSERHAVLACPLGARAHRRFGLARSSNCGISFNETWGLDAANSQRTPIVGDLVHLVIQCRSHRRLLDCLVRLVDELTQRRIKNVWAN